MSKLLTRLVDLGVTPGMPLDLAFALRATNLAAVLLAVVSGAGVAMSVFSVHSVGLALGCALHLVGYLCVLFVISERLYDAGRFAFLTIACSNYSVLLVVLGVPVGVRMWLIALVVYPAIGFARSEDRKALSAYLMIAATFVVSELLCARFGPLVDSSPASIARSHYFVLFAVCAVVGFGLRYYQSSSFLAREQLDAATSRIAELLSNVLPPSIVARLEQEGGVIADTHGEATVLFADLTGFSTLTRRLSPPHLVEVLNLIFSRYDEAATRYGIEKIKTIGDCYMAATGVLREADGAAAVEAMADFSLDMLRIIERTAAEIGLPLGVRVGISTGPVISGVIGKQKYSFDVWGDTVNLANRMESTGVAGRVQVSEATYWRLSHAFEFETPGTVPLKGDQHALAYLLVGRKQIAQGMAAAPGA